MYHLLSTFFKFLLIYISFLLLSQNVSAHNKVNFLRVNFPPLWITEGPLKEKGIADEAEIFIQNKFTQYSYSHIDVTVARAQSLMTDKSNEIYCAVPHGKGFFKNVIESKIWVATSGHVLISKKEFIHKLLKDKGIINREKQLILSNFLKKSEYLGLITKSQKYPVLEVILKPYIPKNVQTLVSSNMLSLYSMILKNRADYTFQYESTVKYLQKLGNDISFITIEEVNNHNVPIVIGCNNSKASVEFIKKIDKDINNLRKLGYRKMEEFHSEITYIKLKEFVSKKK